MPYSKTAPLRAAAIAAALVFALVGCEAAEERAAESAIESSTGRDAEVERDGDRTVVRTAEGEIAMTAGDDLKLPADFPDDLWLPEDYRVQNLIGTGDGGQAIGLLSDGAIDRLTADADARMQEHGWEQVMAMQQPEGRMLGYQKDERTTMLIFSPVEDGQVRIAMTLTSAQ